MKRGGFKNDNYLCAVYLKNQDLPWSEDENGIVTVERENKKIADRVLQFLIKKPAVSHIALDEIGSFVWRATDGETDILTIGEYVKKRFGEKAEPLYERLAFYFKSLEDCGFVRRKS